MTMADTILGTPGNDSVEIRGTAVSINGVTVTATTANILLSGLQGNDTIFLWGTQEVTVLAGAGHDFFDDRAFDTIGATVSLVGGDGNDTLNLNTSDLGTISGGAGSDQL